MKALFYDSFVREDYKGIFMARFMPLLDDLGKRLKPLVDEKERAGLKLSAVQMCSSLFFAGLFPRWFKDFLGYDFSSPKRQKEFIAHLLRHYFMGFKIDEGAESGKLAALIDYYFSNSV